MILNWVFFYIYAKHHPCCCYSRRNEYIQKSQRCKSILCKHDSLNHIQSVEICYHLSWVVIFQNTGSNDELMVIKALRK